MLVILSAELEQEVIEDPADDSVSEDQEGDVDETTGLLRESDDSVTTERTGQQRANGVRKRSNYGSLANGHGKGKPGPPKPQEHTPAWARRNLIGARQSWWEYLRGYAVCATLWKWICVIRKSLLTVV